MNASRVRFARHLLAAILVVAGGGLARAFVIWAETNLTPFERLLANAERDVRVAPNSHQAHYQLARLHYLAFSTGLTLHAERFDGRWRATVDDVNEARRLRANELARDDLNEFREPVPLARRRAFDATVARRLRQLEQAHWTPATSLPSSKMAQHAATAMRELARAIELDPDNAHYALVRACLSEQFLDWRRQVNLKKATEDLEAITEARVRDYYLEAFRLGFAADEKQGKVIGAVSETVTFEAGNALLRLLDRAEKQPKCDESSQQVRAEVEAKLEQVKQLPKEELIQLISPIVFSLEGEGDLTRLLDTEARVDFDLRGFGPRQRWSWVRPNLGLLVWDPQRSGIITSGRQLFGNYTFQVVWETGYSALAALDDDGDGVLRGPELNGLRVWFDRNSDGVSTPDEVVDLADCGIVGIAVKADGMAGIHPTNSRGLQMADGRTLPTWDWMAEPIRNQTER